MSRLRRVEVVDDLDGSAAAQTIRFALDGHDYAIDLNLDNAQRLRDALAPYAAVARITGPTLRARRVLRIAVTPEA